jgi:hypothetical protein
MEQRRKHMGKKEKGYMENKIQRKLREKDLIQK